MTSRLALALLVAVLMLWLAATHARAAHPAMKPPAYWHSRVVKAKRTLAVARRNERLARQARGFGRDAVWLSSLVVWGPIYGPGAFRVARCESSPDWTRAYNAAGGYRTAWQLSPAWVARLGYDSDALGQARDAHYIWASDGGSWREWSCAWAAG